MNGALLKAKIIANGENQKALADALGLSLSALNAKINGHSDFRQNEINFIKKHYALSPDEINSIFFSDVVS